MKRFYIVLAALLVVANTTAARKKSSDDSPTILVQRLENAAQVAAGDFAYSLPRTLLRVRVTLERTLFTRGPYAEYAEKYLGLQDVRRKSAEQHTIAAVEVVPMQESDPSEIYIVRPVPSVAAPFFRMQKMGLVLSLPFVLDSTPSAVAMPNSDWTMPPFTNVGYEVGVYKNVPQKHSSNDSTSPPQVVPQGSPAPKSREAQAAEAAKTLTQLRRRRLELISGEIESAFSNANALKTAVDELKEIERQYLELFIGKTQYSTAVYYYDVVPEKGKDNYPLFFLSDENGIVSAKQANVALLLQCSEPFSANSETTTAAYKYRIPCISTMKVVWDDAEIFRGRCAVFQYGRVVNLFP